jgi:hypothetical protein
LRNAGRMMDMEIIDDHHTYPNQEQAVREAIRSGQVASVDEIIKRTLDELRNGKFIPWAAVSLSKAWVCSVVRKTPP